MDDKALARLVAKDEIRELALLYSRGVDRQDFDLLRTLYTKDGYDAHGKFFSGPAEAYVDFLARSLPHLHMSGHYICNHLISVNADLTEGEGEVYALAYHIIPDGKGGFVEDLQGVRYCDQYRKEADGRWRFARRDVMFDMRSIRPVAAPDGASPVSPDDASYAQLKSPLFGRDPRG